MTQKFGRQYRVTIDPQDGGQPIIITMPFTLRFSLTRDIFSALNSMTLDIYNLSEQNQSRLYQDRYIGGAPAKNIKLEAGYSTLYTIYDGVIFRASSARERSDIVTHIECLAGNIDIQQSQVFTTLQSGQTVGDILKYLMQQFPTLKPGAVGGFTDKLNRPVVLNGSTWNLLKQYSAGNVYIDNGKVYCLKKNEVLPGSTIINDQTGILETPRRDLGFLSVSTLLETGIGMQTSVQIESTVQQNYNGIYSVIGIQHRGIISEAVNGDCRSIFKLLHPNQFGPVSQVAPL